MARELHIKITTEADVSDLTKLAQAFDKLEESLKGFDNKTYLQGLEGQLDTFKANITSVTSEVRELAAALNQLGGTGGIKGFQQALGKGINVNLKGAKVAYKDIQTIAAETTAEIEKQNNKLMTQKKLEQTRGRIKRANMNAQAKIDAEAENRANAQKIAVRGFNNVLEERNRLYKQTRTSTNAIDALEEKERQLTASLGIQMDRRERAMERFARARQRVIDVGRTARPEDMSAINRDFSKAASDIKAVNNELERAQNAWAAYSRKVQDNIVDVERLVNATRDQINQTRRLEQAERAAGRDASADAQLRIIDQQNAQLREQVALYNRLNTLSQGGRIRRELPGGRSLLYGVQGTDRTMTQNIRSMTENVGHVQAIERANESYIRSVQQVKQAEAQRAAQFTQSIAGMQRFANQLRQLAASFSQFAATLRTRVNSSLSNLGTSLTGLTRSASSRFASLRAQLDATGNAFIGFGRKSNQGTSQAEMALNNFFSAGWSMLASGGVVSMFGRNLFDRMSGGLQEYMVQEMNMVRLGISGGVWDYAREGGTRLDGSTYVEGERPYTPGDIRPLQDLVFGIQSGAFNEMGKGLTAFNATELTDALYYFSSAIGADLVGQEGVITARAMEPMLRIAAVTQTGVETMIKGTLNTMMEFGYDPRKMIEADETDMFDQVAAMVAVASNVSSMEVTDVFEAFKMMGPAIHKLTGAAEGAGLEDAMAAIFMASEVGLKGGNVGRGLDRLVTQLLDPDGPMQGVIKKYFGDDATIKELFFDDKGYLKGGLKGVFDTLINSELSDPELASMMGELFTQNAARAGIGIMDPEKLRAGADVEGSWAWFQEMIESDRLEQFASTAAMAMENTVSASFTNMGNAWNMVQQMIVSSVRDDLIGAFTEFADVLWRVGYAIRDNPALGRFVAYFTGMVGAVSAVVGGLMVFAGTLLLVARAFHTLGGMVAPVVQMLLTLPSILATMAPMLLLIAAAATAFYVAWTHDLLDIRTRFTNWKNSLGMDDLVGVLESVTTWVTRVGRAFHELIGGVFMGAFTGPFNNLQALLQDMMGVPLGNRAFVELVELGGELQMAFSDARAGETEGFFGSMVSGAERAEMVIKNLAGSVRAMTELFVFGQTTTAGGQALTAMGEALNIDQPVQRAAQAMGALNAAFDMIGDRIQWVIGEWRQFIDALSETTSIGDVLAAVFSTLAAAAVGFVMGFTAVFGRVATIGTLAIRTLTEGIDGLVTRMRTAAATLSSGGGIGETIARGMMRAAQALERFGGIIDNIRARFQSAGVSIQGIAAAVGAAIGAALGVRLIAMLTPGLGLMLRFGTMLGQIGVWALQAAAQFAIFGARVAVALGTALVQMGLFIVQLGISAAAWAIETLARIANAGAAATQTAANTGLIASLITLAGNMIFSAVATGTLTGAFLALDFAAAPFIAIAAAIVLALVAIPALFFATAAAIFVLVSATSGLRDGFSATIDFFQAFWAVASQLQYVVMALVAAFRLATAPIRMVMEAIGLNLPMVQMLGYAFGAAALIIGGAFAGAILTAAAPFLILSGAIYIGIRALQILADNWRYLYDVMVAILGVLDGVVESSFNYVGEKIDWLIAKIQPLIDILQRLAGFAGLDINVSEDGKSLTVGGLNTGLDGSDAAAAVTGLLAGGPVGAFAAVGGKTVAELLMDKVIVPFTNEISDVMTSGVSLGGQELHDFLMTTFSSAALTIQSFGTMNYDDPLLRQRGIFSANDIQFFSEDPSRYPQYQNNFVDNIARPYDPEGRLGAVDRFAVSEYANLVEDLVRAGRYTGQPVADARNTGVSSAQIKNAMSAILPQGAYDDATATYVVEQAYQAGLNQFNNQQQQALTTLDEIQSSSAFMTPFGAGTAAQTAVEGGAAVMAEPPANPARPDRSVVQQGIDLISDLLGPEGSDVLLDYFDSWGFDLENGELTGLEVMDAAFYNEDTSWMMESMFPGYREYQQQMSEHGRYLQTLASFDGDILAANQFWQEMYGTPPPQRPNDDVLYGGDAEEGRENAEDIANQYKAFMESVHQATRDTYLAEDFGSGMRAVFGNMSAGGAFGSFAESIMGNIDEETLKANPWFNQDELAANAAIYGGRGQAMQGLAGKNMHDALRPMLETTAAELGVTVDSLLADLPTYYFDPKLMATAQTSMFSALSNLGPEQGALLDTLGINPDENGRVFEEMGLDFAELTQYAISNAMAGQEWDLSHYLMDAWDLTQSEAESYIRDNGLDPRVINDSMFEGIEAAYLSSNGQVAVMTEEWGTWLAEATENGLDPVIDITRRQFEAIPEAYRIAMSNMGYVFNIVNQGSEALAAAEASINQLTTSNQGLGTVFDTVGGEADNFFNALNSGALKVDFDPVRNEYTITGEHLEEPIVVPAAEYDAFVESLGAVEEAAKEAYGKWKEALADGEGEGKNIRESGVFDPVTGDPIMIDDSDVAPLTYDQWRAAFWEGSEQAMMENEEATQKLLGFDMSAIGTYMHQEIIDLTNDIQGTFSRNMNADTQISSAIADTFMGAFDDLSGDTGPVTTAANNIANTFKTAIQNAFGAGGGESFAGQGLRDEFLGEQDAGAGASSMVTGLITSLTSALSTATIDVSGFQTNFQTAVQTGVDGITISLTAFGTAVTASATEWGTAAGAAFAAAYAAAAVITGGSGGGGSQQENGETPGRDGGGGTAGAEAPEAQSSTVTVTVTMDNSQFLAGYNTVTQILLAISYAIATPTININASTYFNGAGMVNTSLILLDAKAVDPTVNLNDNASGPLGTISQALDNINRTVTATVNIVTNGSVPNVPGMATGGIAAGGMTLVGEEGPEYVDLPSGSRVFNADATRTMLSNESMLAASPFTNAKGFATQTTNNMSVNVAINNPTVRNDDDIDRLATAVSRRLGREVEAMMNGQKPR